MEDFIVSSQASMDELSSEIASLSALIMLMTLTVVFVVLALCFLISLYARLCLARTEGTFLISWGRRGPTQEPSSEVVVRRRGLNRATLRSLPMVVYEPKDFVEVLECSVCLSETSQGDVIRLLPKCNHGFHLECIDKWFKKHSTCPLCRNEVSFQNQSSITNSELRPTPEVDHLESSDSDSDAASAVSNSSSDSDSDSESDDNEGASIVHIGEALAFPTNVLFWGNEGQVRSLGDATTSSSRNDLVIEIPRDLRDDDCVSPPPSTVVLRLSSLTRLLSRS